MACPQPALTKAYGLGACQASLAVHAGCQACARLIGTLAPSPVPPDPGPTHACGDAAACKSRLTQHLTFLASTLAMPRTDRRSFHARHAHRDGKLWVLNSGLYHMNKTEKLAGKVGGHQPASLGPEGPYGSRFVFVIIHSSVAQPPAVISPTWGAWDVSRCGGTRPSGPAGCGVCGRLGAKR